MLINIIITRRPSIGSSIRERLRPVNAVVLDYLPDRPVVVRAAKRTETRVNKEIRKNRTLRRGLILLVQREGGGTDCTKHIKCETI